MYQAFWRALPGPWPVKLITTLVILAILFWLLMEFVFPWVSAQMPYTDVAV